MTLKEVQKDVESQAQHVQLVSAEVERLKQQLASEKKNVSETFMELQALKIELEKSKSEAEQLKSFADRRLARSKSRLELEDAKNTIDELKEELAYKSNVNRSLGLQLEKTIESNSELLLEIKDLDELLQQRETEIEEVKAELGGRQGNETLENEKASWMQKLEESEKERQELQRIIKTLEGTRNQQVSNANTQELRADNEVLKKELEKAETELAEASKENMNLLSQLMTLRHQTDEKEVMVQQLILQLNDLREKLCLSEELSQSQLDSNKEFLEDLNSKVEGLQARNVQLELLLKNLEETNACLTEELEAEKNKILEREKEKSLLGSQRGQLKILREKIATITENYDTAMKRAEDLDLANKSIIEENSIALAGLSEQLKIIEDKLHESNAECFNLREKIEVGARDADEQVSLLLRAKDAAETTISTLHAELAQLQKQFASLVEAKETGDASLGFLQEAHTGLHERLKYAEHTSSEALRQRDIKIVELTEALNTAHCQLEKISEKLSEVEEMTLTLQEEKASQNSHIKDLKLELTGMKENLEASNKSLSASEDRIKNLQLQNDDLAEMLQSAVSFKEDVVSRLETVITNEAEVVQKLRETEQALDCATSEKATSDQALAELQDRVRLLEDERNMSVKRKNGEEDKRKQHKGSQTQVDALKASMIKMKLEKEKAEKSIQKLQIENTSLAQDLKKWKETLKVVGDELTPRKDKSKSSNEAITKEKRSNKSLDEKDFHFLQDSSMKGIKKSTDTDQKSELMKLRKNAADLRRKLLEQEEEKEDMRKKLAAIQKEAQRKSDLLIHTERRFKDKEREQQEGQRPPTRHSSSGSRRIGMTDSNAPHGSKAMVDQLLEKVKKLEGQLNVKTVELEATKFVLKEKEAGPCSDSNIEIESCVDNHTDMDSQGVPVKIELSHNQSIDSGEQHGLLTNVGKQESLLDEVRKLQLENQQLKNSLSVCNEGSNTLKMESGYQAELNMDNNSPLQWKAGKEEGAHLQEELREMRERYSQMSLQFAELQGEKDELLVTIRSLSRDNHK